MVSTRTITVVAVLVASALAPASVAGSPVSDDSTAWEPAGGTAPPTNDTVTAVTQTVTVSSHPDTGYVRLNVSYRMGSDVATLVTFDSGARQVVAASGFQRRPNGRWKWDGLTESPWLKARLRVNETSSRFGGYNWADTGRWTLVDPPRSFAYYSHGSDRWLYSSRETARLDQRLRVAGQGYAGSSIAFLGDHRTYERTANDERFRLVVPNGSALAPPPAAVLDVFVNGSTQLDVGSRPDALTVFVAPHPIRDGGLVGGERNGTTDIWVSAEEPLDAPANVWLHEYVHARQNATFGPRMQWFREASASYYAGLLAVRQGLDGRAGFERFLDRVHRNRYDDAVLTKRHTWSSAMVPYGRGQRVLASLDGRIREATDGNRSLMTVFSRVNTLDERVDYDDFEAIVANVSGQSMASWLDARLAGRATLEPPSSPFVYTDPSGDEDADGDGLSGAAERALGTHPFDPDTDDDGLHDGREREIGTDASRADTDGDGIADSVELATFSDPTNPLSVPADPVAPTLGPS